MADADVDPGTATVAEIARGGGEGWVAVDAPGDTYLALVAAGRLAHPYRGRGEAAAEWVRDREWWWHATVAVPPAAAGETIELVFDGLDTFADIYLDGVLIGSADNMFRSWRFDLTGRADGGAHDLAVRFHPTAAMVAGKPLPVWSVVTDRISKSRRTLMRKAQFGWGWDWGPDLPTVGIWRPVRIERRRGAAVASLGFATLDIADDRATIRIDVELTDVAEVAVELLDPDGVPVASGTLPGSGSLSFTIDRPRLWWTADLGAQPLYTLVARTAGAPDATRRVGIRTTVLDESPDPDEPGTTFFRFVLNGVPVFARGACWVPASSFVGAIPDATYRDLLGRAVEANMTMIRVWGGGIYEPDIFYDECDRLGLLVWQDFMFACAPYPEDDPAFADNVRLEVVEQVRRLRTHPSLALWCGNNENQAIQFFNNARTGQDEMLAGLPIYHDLIPELLAALDPDTPYWPSSPWGGPTPNSMRGGDVHNWTVWHGIPLVPDAEAVGAFETEPEGVAFTRYAEDMARFVSEFGVQGSADIATLRRWMDPEDVALGSQGFLDRIKDVADKATAMMIPVTGLPDDIEDFVDFTMLCQAEAMRFGIEHYRRRKPHCSGALIWQYNDCWPCVSWSLVDYDGIAKASYFATKRAFAPVIASFRHGDGDAVELWLTNDTPVPVRDTATVTLERLNGGHDWQETVVIDVPANSSVAAWRGEVAADRDSILHVRSAAELFPANRLTLAAVKDLRLDGEPGITVARHAVEGGVRLDLSTNHYALSIRLSADDPATRFDDNHFDLAAGERRSVLVTHADNAPVGPIAVTSWNNRKTIIWEG